MAGRFPHGLDKDSGSQSPASASSPISYRTNVNRQKTKKWAEAKPADYGGDDWGDDDEFDPPPAVPKPTGLRQQGQALNNTLPKLETSSTAAKKDYGDLPPIPGPAPAPRPRANSFDADDEKRNFSSGLARQPSPQPTSATTPATRFSQITGVPSVRSPMNHPALSISTQPSSQPPVTGLRKAMGTPPPSGPAPPDMNPLGRISTGASSVASSTVTSGPPNDYQTRRDFSSAAQPPTLRSGASPEPPVIKAPGQNGGPTQPKVGGSLAGSKVPEEIVTTQSSATVQPTSPSSAAAAQSKALPFIRPADIYRRRMEEERERERQSIDSNRPSMDAVTGAKSIERTESPAEAKQTPDASSQQIAGSEANNGLDPGRLRSPLESVRERKSEYGFDGFQLNDPSGPDLLDSPDYAAHDKLGAAIERRQSTSPQLPNLSRMSGFGMDFLSQPKSEEAVQPTSPSQQPATISIPPTKSSLSDVEEHPLRTEPSLGFKSAVDQAFERYEGNEPSLPPTPASRSNTSIQRTESESTTGISPIMSRLPSTATPTSRDHDVSKDSAAAQDSLPSVKESTEAQGPSEPLSGAAAFKSGHRRDISTPSPGNSAARTPDVAKPTVVFNSQQAAVSETIPVSASETVPSKLPAESEESIRPSLPGGRRTSSEDTLAPERYVSPSEELNEKFDINPAATNRALPDSSAKAAVPGAVLGLAAGERDKSASEASKSENASTDATTPSAKQDRSPSLAPKDGPIVQPATSQALPIVTMDRTSIEEQNDKLHKDIVKRLSIPLNSTAPDGLLALENSDEQDNYDQTRISSYLPSEYENYWAASAEEETPEPLVTSPPKEVAKEAAISQASPTAAGDSFADNEPKPIQPLSPRKPEQAASSLVSPISRRYSWEAISEGQPTLSSGQNAAQSPHDLPQADRDVRQSVSSDPKQPESASDEREFNAEDVALVAGGLAFAGSFGAAHTQHAGSESLAGQRVSSIDENGSAASPNPALLSPHDVEQHDGSSQSQLSPTLDRLSSHSAGRSASLPRSSQSAPTAKIPTFKEISAIESTQQRIKTFDDTRQRFAVMESGLSNWMEMLKAQIPEHADVSTSFKGFGMSGPGGQARAKLPGNGSGQPAYYQQYLNASSSGAPGTPAVRPGSSAPSGSQQGFSPASGGKLTSQQVQAKGKELLHTAGIFGGKAGKAGKGLLAKGKNRLRGDKTSGSLHSKLDRRSSWGLPRSSSRSNPPSRHSGEDSPTVTSQRRRASTLTLNTYPAHNHRPTVSDAMSAPGNLIAPWTVLEAFPAGQSSPPPMPALPPMMKTGGPLLDDEPERTAPFNRVPPAGPEQPPVNGFVPGHENPEFYYQNQLVQEPVPAPPAAHNPSPTLDVAGQTSMGNGPANRDLVQPDIQAEQTENQSVLAPSQVVELHRGMRVEEQQQQRSVQSQAQQKLISLVAQPMSPVKSSAATSSGSSSQKPHPEMKLTNAADETLTVPPPTGKTRARGNSSTSILDRPRYSYDIPRPTEQVLQSQPQTNKPPPSFYFPSLMDPPGRSYLGVSGSSSTHGEDESRRDSKSEHSFEGLPPIRRISGIGFDFNPLDSEVSLPSANDDDVAEPGSEHVTTSNDGEGDHAHYNEEIDPFDALQRHSYAEDSQAEIFAAFRAAADLHEEDGGRGPQQPGAAFTRPQPQTPRRQPGFRPPVPYAVSPMQSIDPLRRQREQNAASATTGGRLDVAANGEDGVRRSEDARVPPPFPSPGNASDVTVSQHRFSVGASPSTPRAQIRSPHSASRGEDQEERAWRNSWTPQQQPPSSAQRYPELFPRPPVPVAHGPLGADDLPPQYFQSAIPQVSAFIPRQQPTEYQIPGVGPPPDVERPGSRRNSGFFKEIGDRIRSGSRDEGKTTSRDGEFLAEKTMNYDDTDSSIVSEDGPGLKPGRNNFYGRTSTAAGSTHESMVAHPAASRSNLPLSTQSSPTTPSDKKKGFNTTITADPIPPVPPLPKPSLFTGLTVPEDGGKKKRFSGLSSMFSKSTSHAAKGSVSEAARERPSMEPPPQALLPKQAQILGTASHGSHGTPPRTFLSRLTAGGEQGAHSRQDSKDLMSKLGIGAGDPAPSKRDPKPQKDSKPRKKSGAGLLTGIMSRRGTQQDLPEETSSIRSKTIGPPIYHPPAFLSERQLNPNRSQAERSPALAQQPFAPSPPPSLPGDRERDRGRRMSKDRQFPAAPTPNGYTPIRGDGATPARADFDPRNPRNPQQVDPRYPKGARQPTSPLNGPHLYGNSQQSLQDFSHSQGSKSPNLTIESSESSQRRDLRRLSREDILARSPARSAEGQQRPYQLALPDNDDNGLPRPAPMTNEVPIISPPRKNRTSAIPLSQPETAQVAIIQRLIHPALRDSPPSARPLSDDDVFSSNSSGKDDPERGNSKAQIVLGLSPRVSNKPARDEEAMSPRVLNKTGREEEVLGPRVPNKSGREEEEVGPPVPSKTLREEEVLAPLDALQKEMGARMEFTPSPSPPSVGTPISRQGRREPEQSRESSNKPADREGMRIPIPEPKPSPDLYNASPRLPKVTTPALSHAEDDSVGKDDKEVTEGGAGGRSSTLLAELDDPESEMLKRARGKGEEKIPAEEGLLDVDNEPVTMSATSYPGQEWNPYADGSYEDFD